MIRSKIAIIQMIIFLLVASNVAVATDFVPETISKQVVYSNVYFAGVNNEFAVYTSWIEKNRYELVKYDFQTKIIKQISPKNVTVFFEYDELLVTDKYVVFMGCTGTNKFNLFLYDLYAEKLTVLANKNNKIDAAKISGNNVAWIERDGDNPGVYVYKISSNAKPTNIAQVSKQSYLYIEEYNNKDVLSVIDILSNKISVYLLYDQIESFTIADENSFIGGGTVFCGRILYDMRAKSGYTTFEQAKKNVPPSLHSFDVATKGDTLIKTFDEAMPYDMFGKNNSKISDWTTITCYKKGMTNGTIYGYNAKTNEFVSVDTDRDNGRRSKIFWNNSFSTYGNTVVYLKSINNPDNISERKIAIYSYDFIGSHRSTVYTSNTYLFCVRNAGEYILFSSQDQKDGDSNFALIGLNRINLK